jgi:rhamnulose-1-phosphate aldolase/alcohol dehydrogenase
MKNRWTEEGARKAIERWGGEHREDLALRIYTARLIGEEPDLVLHGGGNASLKRKFRTLLGDEVDAIHVKGSGWDLAMIEPSGMPALDLAHLRRLRALEALNDDEMVNEIRTHLFDASAPMPSIETLVHAFLPHRYIDHSHADAVLALTNQPDGERLIRKAVGDGVAIVPYVRPGFDLAKAVGDAYEANPDVEGIVLSHHGLISFGDSARESYERHIKLVTACEAYIEKRAKDHPLTPSFGVEEDPGEAAARIAPTLRGLLAVPTGDEDHPYLRSVLEWRATKEILRIINSAEAKSLAVTGPLTSDHLIHTKPWPLLVESPSWADREALRGQLEEAVETYRRKYLSYISEHGGSASDVDPLPCVVWLQGVGVFCRGKSKRQARIAADIAAHTLITLARAHAVGTYTPLPPKHLYDMEYRGLQQAKLGSDEDRPLERHIVVISGGAGAIGAAVAEVCAGAGAHVVVADIQEEPLNRVATRIEQRHGSGSAMSVVMDVTDEASVRNGFAKITRAYGGVDVIVPNAGIAHVSAIEDLSVDDFRRVMEVNATGYLLFMKEGIRILKEQGLGGHIVINASKNVFGPGRDFAAYSASKAAGHQLGKVAAIELAPHNIRVNMINADAIFGDEETPSGLWASVGPQRAKSRSMKTEDLPEYYRGRNLLKARVLGHHVGNAVVFFASNATPTTGATLPVDGGVVEAFPR